MKPGEIVKIAGYSDFIALRSKPEFNNDYVCGYFHKGEIAFVVHVTGPQRMQHALLLTSSGSIGYTSLGSIGRKGRG